MVRVQSALAEAFDAGEDLVGGFGPHERLRIPIGLLDVVLNCSLQAIGADESTALQAAPGQDREPGSHRVEPGGASEPCAGADRATHSANR